MSECKGLWKHKHTKHAPLQQDNQFDDCGHSTKEEKEEAGNHEF